MAKIRGRDTGPEIAIRSALHRRGLRFRVNDRRLPGTPDIVLPRHRAVVLVHGCFWHHHDCPLGVIPRTRTKFWREKFAANRARDERVRGELAQLGWRVCETWECAWRGPGERSFDDLAAHIETWLHEGTGPCEIAGSGS